ncbi:hypothetical protein BZG13_15070, partial [Salinivibrio sp. ML323]|uniref:hypothetical protein n=1 Tax=Salinivibrio sp. ML323 TaxID=1909474 RepID=UPI0009D58808
MINKKVFAQGGLGNQLFQYSFFLHMCQKYGKENCTFDMGRVVYDGQHKGINLEQLIGNNFAGLCCSKNDQLSFLINDKLQSRLIRWTLRFFNIRTLPNSFYDYDAKTSYSQIDFRKEKFIGYFQFVESAIFSKALIEDLILKQ